MAVLILILLEHTLRYVDQKDIVEYLKSLNPYSTGTHSTISILNAQVISYQMS